MRNNFFEVWLSLARALDLGSRGPGFESLYLDCDDGRARFNAPDCGSGIHGFKSRSSPIYPLGANGSIMVSKTKGLGSIPRAGAERHTAIFVLARTAQW